MRQHAEQRIAEAEAKAAQVGKQARDDNAKVGVIHVTISVVSAFVRLCLVGQVK